eukprot:gene22275-27238_t
MRVWNQLKAILWKNWLLKKAHLAGFLAELFLPVAFMALLILIKSITSVYDSPNVAYYCGNTYPWSYSDTPPTTLEELVTSTPYYCTQKPNTCSIPHYYEDSYSVIDYSVPEPFTTYKFYGQYGYVESAASSGQASSPFYAFTVADDSAAYYNFIADFNVDNPSLDLCVVLNTIYFRDVLLAFAPRTDDANLYDRVNLIKQYFAQYCMKKGYLDFSPAMEVFTSENELNNYMTNKDYDDKNYKNGKVAFAVVLINADVQAVQWEYSVRVNYTGLFDQDDDTVACLYGCGFTYSIPTTKFYTMDLFKPQASEYLYGYTYTAYSTLQLMVDKYIMSLYEPDADIKASIGLMPTASYKTDNFQYVISSTLGIFYMLSFLYPVSRIIRSLVLEKEMRIKEGMKMMGLPDIVYNSSWLITTVLQMTVVSILITLITATSVFEYSNKLLVFIYFESFSLAVIMMCFLLATFFSRSKAASLLGPMIFFASFFPYYAVNDPQYDAGAKTATCLLAPACFGLGANVFADYEGGLVGVQSDNVNEETSNFTYTACVSMLILDTIIYGLLAWYFDKVLPSEFGTALSPFFIFSPTYWCGVKVTSKRGRSSNTLWERFLAIFGINSHRYSNVDVHGDLLSPMADDSSHADSAYLEPVGSELLEQKIDQTCVSIQGLRKVFKNKAGGDDKVAVHGLDLDMFVGQVTVLLGHNGAGKSTTISMLVGLIPPSGGDAVMPTGMLLSEDMAKIRNMLGVCPQHDILFPELTALQHLELFASFKGVTSGEVTKAATSMLQELNLVEKMHTRAGALSGGQKRKLSLGMALIGNSKVIVLDEPTSGMDPYSRRSTWSIIQKHKKGRIILLTTHYMDEADLLGDRIAIMSHGRLICCGSPLYLKNKYGVGYTLTIVKTITANNTQQKEQEISGNIDGVVKRYVADAETLSDIGAELSMRLPFSASGTFVDLFHTLDARKDDLGIAEYGISVTTLEEVFLRVGHDGGNTTVEEEHVAAEPTHNAVFEGSHGSTNPVGIALTASVDIQGENLKHMTESEKIPSHTTALMAASDENLFGTHFWALMKKRAIYGKRDRKMVFCQLVLPVLLVIIGLSLLLLKPDLNQPDYVLSPKQYNPTMAEVKRNFVPINIEQGCGTICTDIAERFNGDQDNGVYGIYVNVNDAQITEDSFEGCAQGAAVLEQTSQYLLQTPDDQLDKEAGSSRYGALTIGSVTTNSLLNYNALVNGSAVHGVGIFMNLVHQAFLQVVTTTPTAQIITHNHPLPQTYKQENESATADAFVVALFAMIAVCFIPTSFVVFVVKEREIKAKHQQVISGVSLYAYWLSTYLWDVVSYLPTALLIFAMMFAFDIKAYTSGDAVSIMFLGLLIYGPSTAAITYLLSFMFKSHSTSQVAIMFFNFLTGLCLMIVSFILTYIPSTTEINVSLRYVFRLFPSFCLGDIFTQLSICTEGSSCPSITKDGYDFDHLVSPWDWNTAGANLTFMAIQSVVYFLIALGIEIMLSYPAILSSLNPVNDPGFNYEELVQHEDVDVHAERERVLHNGAKDDIIRLEQLRKVYPTSTNFFGLLYNVSVNICKLAYRQCCGSQQYEAVSTNTSGVNSTQGNNTQTSVKVAVQCLSFGIPKGECFGFLGINGAGKTTTLSILSGELTPTAGKAFIHGYDIIHHQQRIRQLIGYCPQFDALFELLTVREHLELYASIKGLTKLGKEERTRLIEKKMIEMNLTLYSDKLAGSLSGGNKRKLSVAIATIADPPIVFLDEPSSGMDPVARRFMWKVIARMSTLESRCSVMLTTHSMEEAEALCSRIGVMVNGQLQCLGSAQHLKHRFGQGFELTLKLLTPPEEAVHQLLCQLRDARLLTRTGQEKHQSATSPMVDTDIEQKGRDMTEWEHYKLSKASLPAVAQHLGNVSRVSPTQDDVHTTVLLESLFKVETDQMPASAQSAQVVGSASALQFAEFWLLEDRYDDLVRFLNTAFADRAVLIERNSSQTSKYRIQRVEGAHNDLADIFAKFEANKASLSIHEYSVGQTTLEQIFNQFAAKQHNPDQ